MAAYYWCIVDFNRCLDIVEQWRTHLSGTIHGKRDIYLDDAAVAANLVEGAVRYQQGGFNDAKRILNDSIAQYRPERRINYISTYGQDPAIFCRFWLSRCHWSLGNLDTAKAVAQEAVDIAQAIEHPFTKMFAHCAALDIANFASDDENIRTNSEIVSELSSDNNFLVFKSISDLSKALLHCSATEDDATRKKGMKAVESSLGIFNIQMTTKETYTCHLARIYIQEAVSYTHLRAHETDS